MKQQTVRFISGAIIAGAVFTGGITQPTATGSRRLAASTRAAATAAPVRTVTPGTPGVFGDPDSQARYWQAQVGTETCAEMAVADVVAQETGLPQLNESEIVATAEEVTSTATGAAHPVFDPTGGTYPQDVPTLLAEFGVKSHFTSAKAEGVTPGAALAELERALIEQRHVIAVVNGETIWNEVTGSTQSDTGKADHAVLVTGVDTNQGLVYLNDSGTTSGREESVAMATFQTSWATSHDGMVITDGRPTAVSPTPTPITTPTPRVDPAPANSGAFVDHQSPADIWETVSVDAVIVCELIADPGLGSR